MKDKEKWPTGVVVDNAGIRKLILDNPDLPLVFLATEDANIGDYHTMFCTSVSAEIGEVLDCNQGIDDEIIYTDRDDFEDAIYDKLCNDDYDEELPDYDQELPDEWFQAEAKRIASEYAPYWKPCILITVGN